MPIFETSGSIQQLDQPIEHAFGDLGLAHQGQRLHAAARADERHPIGIDGEPGIFGRDIIRDDQIESLGVQFSQRILDEVLRLGRKPDRDLRLPDRFSSALSRLAKYRACASSGCRTPRCLWSS